MRIIAGSARRVQLEVAEASQTRPFLEMARGALFNSLAGRVIDAAVLDLYAGSGALGLEALSRGAASCVFVERDAKAYAALLKNIDKCGFSAEAEPLRSDVAAVFERMDARFDLLFVDPPFPDLPQWQSGGARSGLMLAAGEAVRPSGTLVFRIEDKKVAPPEWPGLELEADKKYGRSRVCRYRKQE
ncbi:MAG: 16S rRNA (guanine(966)-N(2))-methyltransferase RsmD [Planctomycetes bacterium]|nr:16S rRNA (guanine(966)-N(2))-methyltransferase RsmD [Planctomycetota bacterium]